MRIVKISIISLLLFIFGYIGYYSFSLVKFANNINETIDDPSYPETTVVLDKKERINVLILGVDSREWDQNRGRSDSILVASIDPETKRAFLFSVLRDTYVNIPEHGYQKINAAYAFGGPPLTMQVVSNLIDMPIHYYLETDFEGFIGLIDALGGIEINVEKDMASSELNPSNPYYINLKKGVQELDGAKALQYVRFRSDIESDYGRAQRQRKFITAIANEMQSTSSILKVPKILTAVEPYINTNMNFKTMIRLASLGFGAKTEGITSTQLPPKHMVNPDTINGAWVITYDEQALITYVKQLIAGEIDVEGKSVAIQQ